jgi:hypothetical protein
MTEAPIPSAIAMLICDQISIEQGTGKKSLIGLFESLNASSFPAQIRLSIFAKLTDASGHYDFLIRIVNLKDEILLSEVKAQLDFKDMTGAELVVNFIGMSFPEPGKYEFQLYANEVYLHRITMNAVLVQGGQQWPQPPQ